MSTAWMPASINHLPDPERARAGCHVSPRDRLAGRTGGPWGLPVPALDLGNGCPGSSFPIEVPGSALARADRRAEAPEALLAGHRRRAGSARACFRLGKLTALVQPDMGSQIQGDGV